MIRHYPITHYFLLFTLFFQAGCFSTSVVQVAESQLSKEAISAKLKSRLQSTTSITSGKTIDDVGLIIELRSYARDWRGLSYGGWREKAEVYTTVSTQIMAAFQEAGVAARLIHDEADPRWIDVGPVVYVQYSESVRTETSGGGLAWGWEPGPKIPIAVPPPGQPGSPLYMKPVQTQEIIDPSVRVTIYNSEGNEVDTEFVVSPRGVVETFLESMNIQPSPVFRLPDELKRALATEPRTTKDSEKRGDAYLAMHEYNTAIGAFESAIRLAPKDKVMQSVCRNKMGLAYAGLKEWDQALQEYEKAMSCQPRLPASATIKLNMSIACVNLERYDRALQECEEALALGPPPELSVTIKMHMVKPLYFLKEYKQAAELVQYLNLRRQELDDLVGREVVEEIISKARSEASN